MRDGGDQVIGPSTGSQGAGGEKLKKPAAIGSHGLILSKVSF
jgi:hypothetical protein